MDTDAIYEAISVFQDWHGHILIHDKYYPLERLPNQYFDIHIGEIRYIDDESMNFKLAEVTGEQRECACRIYMYWKWLNKKDLVIKQAEQHFPLRGKFTPFPNQPYPQIEDEKQIAREQSIKKIVQERNITSVFHFTHTNNLASILNLGLLCRSKVEELPDRQKLVVNDNLRLDCHPETISLSIGFPNYKLFTVFRNKGNEDLKDSWVVIGLKPDLLWELECFFYCDNAANGRFRKTNMEELKSPGSLEKLFQDFDSTKRKDLSIPDWFPTNPQAEVLVVDSIPLKFFLKVYFHNKRSLANWLEKYPGGRRDLFVVEPDYFSPRCDYKFWQDNSVIHGETTGINPDEKIFFESIF